MSCFSTPFGEYSLLPLHHHPKSPLQAWNAADELALIQLKEARLECGGTHNSGNAKLLLVNDTHGALMTSLHHCSPVSWSDSLCSKLASQQNLRRNQLEWKEQAWFNGNEIPKGTYDFVVIKIPKSLSFLKHQLHWIRSYCHPNTQIIGAAMVKHLSSSMVALFEEYIGPTETSLARKKARLVLSKFNPDIKTQAPPILKYPLEGTDIQLHNYPNVFAQQKLDIGTRFLLQHFPVISEGQVVIDLGCGNGALGCFAARKQPQASIIFCDDSFLALESAKSSWQHNNVNNPAQFFASDGLSCVAEKADWILCNPPFHQGSQVENQTPLRMFHQSRETLKPGGKLLVVGNRHLNYHQTLKRYFNKVELVASNKKFVVLCANNSRGGRD